MSGLAAVAKGLWNLGREERREVYRDLRRELALSEEEPMLPLPEPALQAWAQRFAELLSRRLAQHPLARAVADARSLEQGLLPYGQPATDAFFEAHRALGERLVQLGLPGLYVHGLINALALPLSRQAAREVLPPEHAALIEERYPPLMLLRHALLQEGVLGFRGEDGAP